MTCPRGKAQSHIEPENASPATRLADCHHNWVPWLALWGITLNSVRAGSQCIDPPNATLHRLSSRHGPRRIVSHLDSQARLRVPNGAHCKEREFGKLGLRCAVNRDRDLHTSGTVGIETAGAREA